MQYRIHQIPEYLESEVSLPASKSVSNRLLIMSALSPRGFSIRNLSDSDDTRLLRENLDSGSPEKDAGHAGTAMRFLTAFLAITEGNFFLTGTQRMKQRPIEELVERLRDLGANIAYAEKEGYPPLIIQGKALKGGKIRINAGISSQYISALMMIGPSLEKGLEIHLSGEILSSSYIDLTLNLMKMKGIQGERTSKVIRIGPGNYNDTEVVCEPDWSSASYWFALTGLLPSSRVLLKGLKKTDLQGDRALTGIFDGLGVESLFSSEGLILHSSPVVKHRFEFDFRNNPDLVQTLVPYCAAQGIPFHFRGCRSLRIKETDRVYALTREMGKFGIRLESTDSGNEIWWEKSADLPSKSNIILETYKDHRMAMGLLPLACVSPGLSIEDPGVVSKSYPGFWEDLKKAGFGIEISGEEPDS